MAWYSTGTIAVTNGSKVVTGTGTSWFGGLQSGWGLVGPDGRAYEIDTVNAATSITLKSNYQGSTAGGQAYAAFPTMSLANDLVDRLNTLIADFQGVADEAGAGKFGSGNTSAPGMTFLADQDTGFSNPAANQLATSTGGTRRTLLTSAAYRVDVPITGTAVTQNPTDATAGRLLKVGDFGLGVSGSPPPPSVTDIDDPTTATGFYRSVGPGTTGVFPPLGSEYGVLEVQNYDAQVTFQRYRPVNTSETWSRYWRNSSTPKWSPWVRLYSNDNILGTVSQSGGVPTGAVIQRGSNSNGEYVRFADGTMICTGVGDAVAVTTAKGALYGGDAAYTWTYPAAFVVAPVVSGSAGQTLRWVSYDKSYAANVGYRLLAHASSASLVSPSHIAIGRWF